MGLSNMSNAYAFTTPNYRSCFHVSRQCAKVAGQVLWDATQITAHSRCLIGASTPWLRNTYVAWPPSGLQKQIVLYWVVVVASDPKPLRTSRVGVASTTGSAADPA